MARRRRSKRSEQRDSFHITNPRLLAPTVSFKSPSRLVSDRREFHPDGYFAPVFSTRKDQRVVHDVNVNKGRDLRSTKFRSVFGFNVPAKVDVCVRRKTRKEVLFALNRTGKGSRAPKRRNYWSDVKC